jgi:glucose/mannose-6-phosphate isomerase
MRLNEIDTGSMRNMIEAFPSMLGSLSLSDDLRSTIHEGVRRGTEGICLMGMGGSSIAGQIAKSLLQDSSKIPIVSIRDYSLPLFVDADWAVVATSYSGNTEETLSVVKQALDTGCRVLAITSGGTLRTLLDDAHIAPVPAGFQPRAALPLLFTQTYAILEDMITGEATDLRKTGNQIEKAIHRKDAFNPTMDVFVQSLKGRLPLFMGTKYTEPVAYRAKCQLNENSKLPAFWATIPEANHNEIESIGHFEASKIIPIFIRSFLENERLAKRLKATSSVYQEEGLSPIHLRMNTDNRLVEALGLTCYLDMVSLELAEASGADPLAVKRITRMKQLLADP